MCNLSSEKDVTQAMKPNHADAKEELLCQCVRTGAQRRRGRTGRGATKSWGGNK